ncbi:putative transcription factor C2H2 family [Rosa chinensis]|uniref:RING-type E3 ubiquitin transferase n=1 Tax=Rosa chinensis TaxID=74649 RepID=A0A2P6QAU7_ROSCH|nr:putative transcription factor C2H2 family [Rosa chinensis]
MFSDAFIPPPAPPSYPDIPTKIIACISIVTLFFLLINHMLNIFLAWILEAIPELDPESGGIIYGTLINVGSNNQFRQAVLRFLQRLGVIKDVIQEIDAKRGPRLRDMKKLPPLVHYGSNGIELSSSRSTTDCAICLEDFSEGESCQVFPMCKHVFHSNCIDHWLVNRSTCPICRNCIIDE